MEDLGAQVVERMPIGSHHTWVGLLFTYGLVGFIAQATPYYGAFRFTNQGTEKQGCQSGVKYNIILFIMSLLKI